VKVITPNPKTGGGARWNFLAAWGYAQKKYGTPAKAEVFVRKLLANVPILDSGARGSTVSFAERGIGDVLVTWENEALLTMRELGADRFEIVVPSVSIRAEPPVAIIDKYVDKHGTRDIAEAYLRFLYSPQGQAIIARNGYRPRDPVVMAKYRGRFPPIEMFDIDRNFGGWAKAQSIFFADDGIFDRIYAGN
jgi:sulfate transport system substrate-binding protein